MKVFLLHPDRDFQVSPALQDDVFRALLSRNLYAIRNARRDQARAGDPLDAPSRRADVVTQDLELTKLWNAMAAGDEFLFEAARCGVLSSLHDADEIVYRQQVLADCLAQPDTVRAIYGLAIEALASEREAGSMWSGAGHGWVLRHSVRLLTAQVDVLKRLRGLADERSPSFSSPGFTRFFSMLQEELTDDYLAVVERYLHELEFEEGVRESAQLGRGDKGHRYVVHAPPGEPARRRRFRRRTEPEPYSFELHPRDVAGFRALDEVRGKGLTHVANAVARSADHVASFFVMLRLELAFYLGCVNLYERLEQAGQPTCFPDPSATPAATLDARGIYDVCLALQLGGGVVGNDVRADGKPLVMITGANQGGKSTLLRALGVAQLMMQAGMFVGAEALRADVSTGVFTHFKRSEDAALKQGKLDEELSRMRAIADDISPGCVLLCNESFASTNEREGSEIARNVVRAMLDKRIKVLFVTHMYDLAHGFDEEGSDTTLFVRADRRDDGRRTFKLLERPPLPTSYGADSFERVFGEQVPPAVEVPRTTA